MNTTVEKNNPKIFPQNEGKINSKGMVAPPVPPKSSQAKFAGIKAIFERNVPHSQANDSNKTVSSNLGRTFAQQCKNSWKTTFIALLTNNAAIQGIVVSVILVAALLMMRIEQ
ncbi:hypothetical protein [Wolbachia endosymbiont (group A) of Cydia splendana]|uniref:hypothetical protein n=1 Tax=Wolbachia endosymbiont (group A) of Cydia splendana TaxID=2954000 RepID=UPI0021F82E76|nr:hypothetical protein [Wolbachia endosymbiont (group A) of Cydia splendana]